MADVRIGRQTPTKSVTLPYEQTRGAEAVELYNSVFLPYILQAAPCGTACFSGASLQPLLAGEDGLHLSQIGQDGGCVFGREVGYERAEGFNDGTDAGEVCFREVGHGDHLRGVPVFCYRLETESTNEAGKGPVWRANLCLLCKNRPGKDSWAVMPWRSERDLNPRAAFDRLLP